MQLRFRGAQVFVALFAGACAAAHPSDSRAPPADAGARPQPELQASRSPGSRTLPGPDAKPGTHADLVALFAQWREFQKPKLVDGVPDYTAAAMAAQQRELPAWQRRLQALDPRAWPIPQQVDFHIVRAEMNGLEFDHRVLQPWARNPAFYVTVFDEESDQPAREGPFALGALELWSYRTPLDAAAAEEIRARLEPVPALLLQARGNLTGNARDLWLFGIKAVKQERELLAQLGSKFPEKTPPGLAVQRALDAVDRYLDWLEQLAPSKTGPSGVGIANYDWYLANVQLLPYTWADEVLLVQRELARAKSALLLEENRNRALPEQQPVGSAEEFHRRFNAGISEYMAFLKARDVLTIRPDMEPALHAHIGTYSDKRPLEFFSESDYRDPEILRTHGYHWFDLARMRDDPNPDPIRRGALLYNIFDTRTEGFATAMEELMMNDGMCDARPRSRELIYVLLAQRAARALGDLHMHANQRSLEEAARDASAWTPRGWLRISGSTLWFEQHLYLQQPGYGTSYVLGKLEIDKLIAARADQLGKEFTLRRFMDEKDAAGLIPVSLLRWELTGKSDDVPGVGWPRPQ